LQADAQMRLVEMLVLLGTRSVRAIQDAVAQRLQHRVSAARIRTLIERVQQRWAHEDAQFRAVSKASAERRIIDYIKTLRTQAAGNPSATPPEPPKPSLYNIVHRMEDLLSKIQGTQEPIQVSVNAHVTEAMMQTIGIMDESTMRAIVAEQRSLEAFAHKRLPGGTHALSEHDTPVINGRPLYRDPLGNVQEEVSSHVIERVAEHDDVLERASRLVKQQQAVHAAMGVRL
jgi:ATPase subunit of ABC transporter with duplicated ATPase domains